MIVIILQKKVRLDGFDQRVFKLAKNGSDMIDATRKKENKKTKYRGRAGIEPATSRTRSENNTTRPTAR